MHHFKQEPEQIYNRKPYGSSFFLISFFPCCQTPQILHILMLISTSQFKKVPLSVLITFSAIITAFSDKLGPSRETPYLCMLPLIDFLIAF